MEFSRARILEWVALPLSRGSSQPRDRTQVFHIAGGFFTSWATRKPSCCKWCKLAKGVDCFSDLWKTDRRLTNEMKSIFSLAPEELLRQGRSNKCCVLPSWSWLAADVVFCLHGADWQLMLSSAFMELIGSWCCVLPSWSWLAADFGLEVSCIFWASYGSWLMPFIPSPMHFLSLCIPEFLTYVIFQVLWVELYPVKLVCES